MTSSVKDTERVNKIISSRVVHTTNRDVCSAHYPYAKNGAFTLDGDCNGDYTHQVCRDPTCNKKSHHYDHNHKIHYYHLCYHHTPKDISNGECGQLCVYRGLICVTIDGVVQS